MEQENKGGNGDVLSDTDTLMDQMNMKGDLAPIQRNCHSFTLPGKNIAVILLKNRSARASATVEALMVMPFAFLFVLSITWMIDIFRIHSEVGEIVNDTGNTIVAMSYPMEFVTDPNNTEDTATELMNLIGSLALSELYVKKKIEADGVNETIDNLNCLVDMLSDENAIEISAVYTVAPPLKVPGFSGFILTNKFYSKTYAGASKEQEDVEYVYITKQSEVYHLSKECSSIKKTVNTTFLADIKSKRNKSGKIYYPCEKCGNAQGTGVVYYTPYGTKYHMKADCSSLTPKIYKIPITEIGERRLCSSCD